MAKDGKLSRDDQIRLAGTERWYPAARFDKLFAAMSQESMAPKLDTASPSTEKNRPASPDSATFPEINTKPTMSPTPVSAGGVASFRPPSGHLAIAAVLGLIFAFAVSLLKPSLGTGAIVGIVAGGGVLLGAAVVLMRSMIASLAAQLGSDNSAVTAAKARVGRVLWLGGVGLLVAGIGSLAELVTPPQGLTRTLLAMNAAKPSEPPPAPATVPELDPKAWSAASFVLVNPGREAVAVRHVADSQSFHALEFAKAEQVRQALKIAVLSGVQIIDEKPDLASRIVTNLDPGPITGRLAGELGELWKVHNYLPTDATIVTFQDVKEGKTRVGFLAERKSEEITLVSLSPKRLRGGNLKNPFVTEIVRRADVRSGSQRVGLNGDQLKEVADFLDYTIYHILEKLSASQRGAGYVRVVVEPVTYDDTKLKNIKEQGAKLSERYLREIDIKGKHNITDEIINAKRKGTLKGQINQRARKDRNQDRNRQNASASQNGASIDGEATTETGVGQTDIDLHLDETVDVIKKRSIAGDAEAKNYLNQFDLEEKRLRDIEGEAGTVTTELRARLSSAGVSVLEKSRLDVLDAERKMAAINGSASSSSEPYLAATHILIGEIRDRRGPGQYYLSTRLVKVGTREVVDEVEGERTPPLSVAHKPPVDTPYLLATGQLVVVEFTDDVRPRCDFEYAMYPGGYPVNLPFSGLVPVSLADKKIESDRLRISKIRGTQGPGGRVNTDAPPIVEGMNKRLGFLDDPSTPDPKQSPYRKLIGVNLSDPYAREDLPSDHVPFRDLFGVEPAELNLSKIKSINAVTNNLVPEAHRMRFVAYQIASSILPPAGRITTREDGDLLTVSLNNRNGIGVSDRLRVLRPGLSDRLDFELQVREVQDGFARVAYDPNERIFADRYGPQVGDLVHRRADRTVSLAVLPFKVEGIKEAPAPVPNRMRGPFFNPLQQRGMRNNQPPPTTGRVAQQNFNLEKKTSDYIRKLANELEDKLKEALRSRCNVPLADARVATHLVEGRVTFSSDKDYLVPAHLSVKDRASGKILHELDFKFTEQEGRNWKP